MTIQIENPILTVNEVASLLRCSKQTIFRRVNDGSIRSIRIAGLIRIPREEVMKIMTVG